MLEEKRSTRLSGSVPHGRQKQSRIGFSHFLNFDVDSEVKKHKFLSVRKGLMFLLARKSTILNPVTPCCLVVSLCWCFMMCPLPAKATILYESTFMSIDGPFTQLVGCP